MAGEAEPTQSENAQAKTTWVRNCTPDHLRLLGPQGALHH